jgi:hypothetical protein
MKSRCLNQNHRSFPDYGGRGIAVCERWRRSFANFLADVGPRPSARHSIERIRNDENYQPGNVRWAIPVEQQNNRRCTIFVNLKGERLPLAEACRRLGVNHNTIWMRIDRGMDPDEAIAIPVGERFQPLR